MPPKRKKSPASSPAPDEPVQAAPNMLEKRYRTLIENAFDGIALIGPDARFQYFSPSVTRISGYSPEELIGRTFQEYVHPDDLPALDRMFADLLQNKDSRLTARFRGRHRNGTWRWFDVTGTNLLEDPAVRSIVINYLDVTERKLAEEARQESERFLAGLTRHLPGMIYRCRNDRDWTMDFVSDGCLALTGYPPDDLLRNERISFGSLIHPDDQDWLQEKCMKNLEARMPCANEYRIRTADGREKWVWDQAHGIYSKSGELAGIEGFISDITERKAAEEALRKSESRNRALLNILPDMMFRINREGVFLDFMPAKGSGAPVSPGGFLGKMIHEVLPFDVAEKSIHHVKQALESGETQIYEYKMTSQGRPQDFEARIVVSGENEVLTIVRDITDRKAQAAALTYQALHDTLTGLPNRTLLLDRLDQAIHASGRENTPLSLLIMDLDRFKEVNDALGHHYGDILLKQMGPRVLGVLRESDTIARLGGDEFAVLLPGTDLDGATVAAQKIHECLEQPFAVEGFMLDIGVSMGIAAFPEHGENAEILMRRADVAMYQAKQSGSGFAPYLPEHDRHSPARLLMMGELRHAIDRRELVLHYQPKIDLRTRRTVGVEALVRWQHPQRGLIPPDRFITLAEHIGMIKPLTLWVLKEAARQALDWHRTGLDLQVSVNLSPRNLHDLQLPEQITEVLDSSGARPEWLELEITESAVMHDPGRAMEILTRLRKMGIRFSIDDFGAGYSSLSHLKKMPVGTVKVDKSFVIGMDSGPDDAVIVRSTVDLAHNLGLSVVAEGVENGGVLERLTAMGCDAAQGYHISRPVPVDEITRWLSDSPWGVKTA